MARAWHSAWRGSGRAVAILLHIASGKDMHFEMTRRQSSATALLAMMLATCASCGSGSLNGIAGAVTIDGAPVDVGTISFRPVGDSASGVAGGAIQDGRFQVVSRGELAPGKYAVQVQVTKKTGRTIKDPQRGDVDELVPVSVANSPQEIDLTREGASNLQLDFTATQN